MAFTWALIARAGLFDNDFEEKPWEEVAVQIPAFPAEEDWIEFRIGAVSDKKFFIDVKTLSLGSDGVVRYSLLVLTDQGAKNISYEGMRCSSAERRLYAFGRSDKTWSKARNNQWVKIAGGSNNHHVDFFTMLFCRNGAVPFRNDEDLRRALRSGTPQLWLNEK
jgi:hypothetical protein